MYDSKQQQRAVHVVFKATDILAHRLMSTKIGLPRVPLGLTHNAGQLTSMQRDVDQLVFVQAFGSGNTISCVECSPSAFILLNLARNSKTDPSLTGWADVSLT